MNLTKRNFTKSERRFGRILQEAHISFKTKIKINNREVDFIIGKYAIDIDGHNQDSLKNEMLVKAGYIPIHFHNKEISKLKKINVDKFS